MSRMPRHPKRKFGLYQEPSGTMPAQSSNRPLSSHRPRPIPTPETQELYNKMRQQEEWDLLRRQNEQSGFLQPVSPSQATTASRSPSCASTTQSVTQAMNDMGVDGDQPRPKKARAVRHGPLPDAAKLRAALMRKLHACESCRGRKVKCSHFDLRLFEDEYQKSKGTQTQPPPYVDDFDLFGVEQNPATFPAQSFSGEQDGAHLEIDNILQQTRNGHTPVSPSPASPLYNFEGSRVTTANPDPGFGAGQEEAHVRFETASQQTASVSQSLAYAPIPRFLTANHSPIANRPGPHYLTGNIHQSSDDACADSGTHARRTRLQQTPAQPVQVMPSFQAARPRIITTDQTIPYHRALEGANSQSSEPHIPIGKHVIVDRDVWDCMWGSSETDSSVSTEREPCSQRCNTLDALTTHFASQHAPFYDGNYMWRCTKCRLDWFAPSESCRQCGRFSWQKLYWATVSISSKQTPASPLRVAVDKGTWNHAAWANQSAPMAGAAGGYNGPFMLACGAYENVSGTSQSFMAALAAASESSQQPCRVDCAKISPDDPIRSHDLIAQTLGHASTALPALLAAALFVLVLLETLLSPGRSCVGYSNAVPCLVDNPLPSLSVAFIVAGLMVPWLLRLVRVRLRQHLEAPIASS
ncbi:hypothetical protein MFIFM68171_02598 [Madurella fahalii]|uniref:Uncharacterized protein n=1 Tax=Madurella fahalii TaxID=1157608 RepID=A0ABQ0G3Q9_9PEZI